MEEFPPKAAPKARRLVAALVPVALLLAVGLGAFLTRIAPDHLLALVLASFGLLLLAWIFLSTLWPARADRNCPRCGKDTLERIDRTQTVGLTCPACGWRDETASAWYLAEADDAPILPPREFSSNVDTTPRAD